MASGNCSPQVPSDDEKPDLVWWCRGCDSGGNLLQYLMKVRKLDKERASRIIGEESSASENTLEASKARAKPEGPPVQWRKNAERCLKSWRKALLDNAEIMDWLKDRGLKRDSIIGAKLGWNSKDRYAVRAEWGLPPKSKENGTPRRLWFPEGLVIPCFTAECLQRLRFRRFHDDPKYVVLSGSSMIPMVIAEKVEAPLSIVESELDAILLHQEVGDSINIMALGSVTKIPEESVWARFESQCIFISLDYDEAGSKRVVQWWKRHYPNVKRWPPVRGKDITEDYQKGVNLKNWVNAALKHAGIEGGFE